MKGRRVITTPTWRNKGYYRRYFNKAVFQVKKDVSQGGTKCLALWTITKDEGDGQPAITFMDKDAERIYHLYDNAIVITLLIANYTTRRVLVDNESSADILYYLLTNEVRMRSTSSSMFALCGIWRNKNTTCRHNYITCDDGIIPTSNNQGSKYPCRGLFVFL